MDLQENTLLAEKIRIVGLAGPETMTQTHQTHTCHNPSPATGKHPPGPLVFTLYVSPYMGYMPIYKEIHSF